VVAAGALVLVSTACSSSGSGSGSSNAADAVSTAAVPDSAGPGSSGPGAPASSGSPSFDGQGKTIVIFMLNPFGPYIQGDEDGLTHTFAKYGYKTKVITNNINQSDEDQQVQQYLATNQKPAAFIWWPANAAAGVNDTRLLSRVAPVIQLNQAVQPAGEQYVKFYVGDLDSVNGNLLGQGLIKARAAAKAAGTSLHSPGGNLLVFDAPAGYQGGIDRLAAFKKATASDPFNILASTNNTNADDGYKNALSVIPKYKDKGIDFVYVYDGDIATGVIKALQQDGLTPGKDVQVVDGNCTSTTAPYASGQIASTTLQSGVIEGIATAEMTVRYLADPNTINPGTAMLPNTATYPTNLPAHPSKINGIPLPVLTKNNVNTTKLWGYTASQLCAQKYTP
jgi:ABC-type sugar transport system substrate-binding protein